MSSSNSQATGVVGARARPSRAGERALSRSRVVLAGLFLGTSVAAIRLIGGGAFSGAAAVGGMAGLAVGMVGRPLWGCYLLVGLTIVGDEQGGPFATWTRELGHYLFENWWKVLGVESGARWLVVNTVEVWLGAVALGVGWRLARGERLVGGRWAWGLAGAYVAVLAGMLGYGLATGGALRPALWQIRHLVHFVGVALLTAQVVRSEAAVRGAVWVLAGATVFKAAQVVWLFWGPAGGRFGEWRELVGHEDSIFFVGVIALGVVLGLSGVERAQRWFLLGTLPLLGVALAVNLRRASYVALLVALGLIPVLVPGVRRRALQVGTVLAVVGAVYAGAYWQRPEATLGVPLQKLKSVLEAEAGTSDYDSNLYRVAENLNLRRTIAGHPLGLGFGHPFELHVPLPDVSALLPYWRYDPHNTILGMWMILGTPGFVVFLVYLGSLLMLASHNLRWHELPYVKAVSYFALVLLMSGLVVGTVEQAWYRQRGAVFVGTLAGLVLLFQSWREPEARAVGRPVDT